jgi:hypothetical protein
VRTSHFRRSGQKAGKICIKPGTTSRDYFAKTTKRSVRSDSRSFGVDFIGDLGQALISKMLRPPKQAITGRSLTTTR